MFIQLVVIDKKSGETWTLCGLSFEFQELTFSWLPCFLLPFLSISSLIFEYALLDFAGTRRGNGIQKGCLAQVECHHHIQQLLLLW